MDLSEVKFVLKLLGSPNYREALTKIKPNSKTSAAEQKRICQQLLKRELVAVSDEISKFKIAAPGKALLKLETMQVPITPHELKVLKSCQKEAITPGKTGIPASEAQGLIQALAQKGLIQVNQTDRKIKEVWLTQQGLDYLRHEYVPKGTATISLNLLNNYLRFLRADNPEVLTKPSDEEVLQTIRDLERELRTDNYLPIFYLRQKLQPPLSGEELEQALYRLEAKDKIELSALVEASRYEPAQVNAGIKQRSGSPLFFIKVIT